MLTGWAPSWDGGAAGSSFVPAPWAWIPHPLPQSSSSDSNHSVKLAGVGGVLVAICLWNWDLLAFEGLWGPGRFPGWIGKLCVCLLASSSSVCSLPGSCQGTLKLKGSSRLNVGFQRSPVGRREDFSTERQTM